MHDLHMSQNFVLSHITTTALICHSCSCEFQMSQELFNKACAIDKNYIGSAIPAPQSSPSKEKFFKSVIKEISLDLSFVFSSLLTSKSGILQQLCLK